MFIIDREKRSKAWNHTNTHGNNAKESWHFQTSEIYKTWAILHLFGQPSLFHPKPWQVISAFTSCVGALSTFSTCHLDLFHQNDGRLDYDDDDDDDEDDDDDAGGSHFGVDRFFWKSTTQ